MYLLIKILFKINSSLIYIAPPILLIINPYSINITIVLIRSYLDLIDYPNTLKERA